MTYICPVCGYNGLDTPPYKNVINPPYKDGIKPPYVIDLGDPSYDVCPCCGFEYGNDDNPIGTVAGDSFEEYRKKWITNGAKWFDEKLKPANWNLEEQLKKANP